MEAVEKADEGNGVFCGFSDGRAAAGAAATGFSDGRAATGAAATGAFHKNLNNLRDHQISLIEIHHYAFGACVPC